VLSHSEPPFLATTNVPSIEAFTEVEFAALAEVFGERIQDIAQDAFAAPLLESAMAGLVRGETAPENPPTEFHFLRPGGMPSRTSRLSFQGLPHPSSRRCGSGMRGAMIAHC